MEAAIAETNRIHAREYVANPSVIAQGRKLRIGMILSMPIGIAVHSSALE
jgi:hypothetical protein